MSMADTIAVMNGGRIEQAGSATDLYERPQTAFVANFLGDLQPRRRAHAGASTTATRRSRPTTAPALHVPSDRCNGTADDVRVGVRPEKITLVPAGEDGPGRRQRAARQGRRGGVPRRLDPVRDPDRGRRGAQRLHAEHRGLRARLARRRPRRPARPGARSTRSWSPVAEHDAPAVPRARRLAAAGVLADRLRDRGHARARASARPRRSRRSATRRCRSATGRSPTGRCTSTRRSSRRSTSKFGGHVKYVEDINDNDEFYGKVRQQLQADQPIGRDIVTLTDFMAVKWVRNRYVRAARQEEHAERRRQPRRQPQERPVRQEARLHGAVAVGRGRPRVQPEEDRARAELGQRPLRPGLQGPRDDALRAV